MCGGCFQGELPGDTLLSPTQQGARAAPARGGVCSSVTTVFPGPAPPQGQGSRAQGVSGNERAELSDKLPLWAPGFPPTLPGGACQATRGHTASAPGTPRLGAHPGGAARGSQVIWAVPGAAAFLGPGPFRDRLQTAVSAQDAASSPGSPARKALGLGRLSQGCARLPVPELPRGQELPGLAHRPASPCVWQG